jgi:hypothetical protein
MKAKLLNDENRPAGRRCVCVIITLGEGLSPLNFRAVNGEYFDGMAVKPTGWLVSAGRGKIDVQILRFTTPRCPLPSVRLASVNSYAEGQGRRRIRLTGGKRSCAMIAQDWRFFLRECLREIGSATCARPLASDVWTNIVPIGHKAILPN